MSRTFIVLVLLLSHFLIKAQTNCYVRTVFKQIKLENISENLKDSIMINSMYYPQTNVPEYVEYYSLNIDSLKEKGRIEYGFESGQSAYAIDEIKLFKKSNGNYKVIYSHSTGANATHNQDRLIIYDFDVNTKLLKADTSTYSIFNYNLKDFFSSNTIPSGFTDFETNVEFTYDLFYTEKHDVELRLICFLESVNLKENKSILGDIIGFKWINDKFVKLEPYFFDE